MSSLDGDRQITDRVRRLEDWFEISNLIASHPPTVDTGAKSFAASVWVEDGVFDRELGTRHGREAIADSMASPGVAAAIHSGLAHFSGLPHVAIRGDIAVAISYLQLLGPDVDRDAVEVPNHGTSKGYRVHRVVANRWELVRTPEGWRIKRRTIRLIDGTEPARELLRGALVQ